MINKKIFQQELEDWDKNAQFYAEKNTLPYYQIINDKLINFYKISKNEKILEAGGGAILTTGNNITVIDFSKKMIELAKKLNPYGKFIISSVHQIPTDDKQFDVIIANDLFHHVKAQGLLEATATEFKRVLKNDGRLCVFERSSSLVPKLFFYLRKPFKSIIKKHQCSSRNEVSFSNKDLKQILQCGFKIYEKKYIFSLPFQILAVAINVIQYLFGYKITYRLQVKTKKIAAFLENKFNYKHICAQQIFILKKK
ncbi:class I SAM-dependent methyltransferase [Patescibacteria group bacterium]|nr:class I SAM-dependent methyltransferase [Patescibacteria group bacterium]